jgi:cysteine peptidase B
MLRKLSVAAGVLGAAAQSGITDEDRKEFAQWKVEYGKSYANGEEEMRLQNYVDNRAKAAALDAENPLATFGVNEFSDLSEAEFGVYHNAQDFYALPKDPSVTEWPAYSDEDVNKALATSIDWVSKGAVTGVKNQGSCGSCWAFSATGNIEGQWKLAGNKLTSVSEQQLVDCDHMGDQGCQGGLPENAFKYVKKSGLETEQQYSYTGRGGSCRAQGTPAVTISGQTSIQHNEGQMLTFLQQKGPISIGVDASRFQTYRGGVMTSCSAGQLDHGVLIVGYGTQGGSTYWKIKNSWGGSWGESGYIRVAYGKGCAGLNQDPQSSVVQKADEAVAATTDAEWEAFKAEYGRNYVGDEEVYRHSVFTKNMAKFAARNAIEESATFGVDEHADWTEEEFSALLGYVPEEVSIPAAPKLNVAVPASKDWTGTATTPVKNQKSCGSCWAFSATEQIESDYILQHGKTVLLAPQELVDCKGDGSKRNGCQGGNTGTAYKVIEQLGGIEGSSDYPYTAKNGQCKFSASKEKVKVTGYQKVGQNDETEMKSYVGSTGPLSVCVAAKTWHGYKGGVMSTCDTSVDHCVQVVGYGEDNGKSYWKVRNSWGTSWGEDGFLRIEIGKNLCKIASDPTKVQTAAAAGPEVVV